MWLLPVIPAFGEAGQEDQTAQPRSTSKDPDSKKKYKKAQDVVQFEGPGFNP